MYSTTCCILTKFSVLTVYGLSQCYVFISEVSRIEGYLCCLHKKYINFLLSLTDIWKNHGSNNIFSILFEICWHMFLCGCVCLPLNNISSLGICLSSCLTVFCAINNNNSLFCSKSADPDNVFENVGEMITKINRKKSVRLWLEFDSASVVVSCLLFVNLFWSLMPPSLYKHCYLNMFSLCSVTSKFVCVILLLDTKHSSCIHCMF